jgi:predicted acyl esterase
MPTVHIVASTNAKSAHWVAHLMDADKPSSSEIPDNSGSILNRGYLDAKHRLGVKQPQELSPGEAYVGTIRLYPHADVIPKGHHLRLVLDNSDEWAQQDTAFAASIVHFGSEGTRLTLPLAPRGSPIPADALRPELKE